MADWSVTRLAGRPRRARSACNPAGHRDRHGCGYRSAVSVPAPQPRSRAAPERPSSPGRDHRRSAPVRRGQPGTGGGPRRSGRRRVGGRPIPRSGRRSGRLPAWRGGLFGRGRDRRAALHDRARSIPDRHRPRRPGHHGGLGSGGWSPSTEQRTYAGCPASSEHGPWWTSPTRRTTRSSVRTLGHVAERLPIPHNSYKNKVRR